MAKNVKVFIFLGDDKMTCEITIRDINVEDFISLTGLLGELGYPSTSENVVDRFNKIIGDSNFKTLVAETNGKIVGFIGLCKSYAYERNGCYARIVALVVNKEHRNCGIGTKLINSAEKWAIDEGAFAIGLASGIQRKEAHIFYCNRGYKIQNKEYYFWKSL